jgi:hypothetical protein
MDSGMCRSIACVERPPLKGASKTIVSFNPRTLDNHVVDEDSPALAYLDFVRIAATPPFWEAGERPIEDLERDVAQFVASSDLAVFRAVILSVEMREGVPPENLEN